MSASGRQQPLAKPLGLCRTTVHLRDGKPGEDDTNAACRYRHKSHWVGAASRLGRDLSGSFGSKSYAREELVAEMAGAFVCASLGIAPTVRHADYIGSWLELCSPLHNSSNREVSIMRRTASGSAALRRFRPQSFALFQSVSSQASRLASRFHDGGWRAVAGGLTCSSAFRLVSKLALA